MPNFVHRVHTYIYIYLQKLHFKKKCFLPGHNCVLPGTFVMHVIAHDKDLEGTDNSKIAYSIIKQDPPGSGMLFSIDRNTGQVFVKEPTLDREVRLPQLVRFFIDPR